MRSFSIVLLSLAMMASANATLIISAASDGTNAGGIPKAIQLMATANIPDLSAFWLLRDTNGTAGGPFTVSQSLQLPVMPLAAGDKFVIFGNADSETIAMCDGTYVGITEGIAGHNGDDIFAVSTSAMAADAIDGFGLLGQGDTDFAANSLAIRSDMTPNAAGVMDAGNFTISAYEDVAFCDQFFVPVPEPSSVALLCLSLICFVGLRRR